MAPGGLEHDVRAVDVDADALDGAVPDDEGTDRGGEVEDGVGARHQVVDQVGVEHRAAVERQRRVVRHGPEVLGRPGAEVVERDDLVVGPQEVLHQVGADEAGGAGDERPHHAPPTSVRGVGTPGARGVGTTSPSTSVTPASGRRRASSRS